MSMISAPTLTANERKLVFEMLGDGLPEGLISAVLGYSVASVRHAICRDDPAAARRYWAQVQAGVASRTAAHAEMVRAVFADTDGDGEIDQLSFLAGAPLPVR